MTFSIGSVIRKANEWLIVYGAKGDILPTIFDLKELWEINSSRFEGFNIVFLWLYVVCMPYLIAFTILPMIEAIFRWLLGRPKRHPNGDIIWPPDTPD